MPANSSQYSQKKENGLLVSNIIHNVLIETFPANYRFDTHIHKDCEFYLILDGECQMTVANQNVLATSKEYVLIMPFIPHSFSVSSNQACRCFHMHFDLDYFHGKGNRFSFLFGMDVEEYFSIHVPFYLRFQQSEQLKSCCHTLLTEYQNLARDINFSNFYLVEFLLLLSRDIRKTMVSSSPADSESIYINQTLMYISQNYTGKILLQDIAAHLNISVRYLTKIFHEKMHLSILSYINAYRVHQATILMKQGVKLTDIAIQVGFSSHPHFTKTFTKIMATTPKQYRSYLILTKSSQNFRKKPEPQ